MPMKWSYVGKLGRDGGLDWGGGCPASGTLPDINELEVYLKIRDHAREGRYEGTQVDWGAFAIKVNGPALLNVLEEALGDLSRYEKDSAVGGHIAYVRKLGSDKYVALVSTEL